MTYSTVPSAVQAFMDDIEKRCNEVNPQWGKIFKNVFSNTLITTVDRVTEDETYIITGDIPAMWLRDSTAQVRPYLVIAEKDEEMKQMIRGLINRQFILINHDPYANAFNADFNGAGHQTDNTELTDLIWERKYEIDSLAYPIQLSYLYYKSTHDDSVFNETYIAAVKRILDVWETEQNHENSPYNFERDTWRPEDTLSHGGKGSPVAYTGMTWSGFRPSDDSCKYHYLVPSNMFAVVTLRYLQEIFTEVVAHDEIVKRAAKLEKEIEQGIKEHAIIETEVGPVYAYEVDGLGNYSLMDDPNVPSLLSAPYLGYVAADDEVYQNTRNLILSEKNPYYYEGKFAKGCGSSHTPENYIWPIALSLEGLTAKTKEEKAAIINTLVENDGGTMMMHESFNVDNPEEFTREWFSWANMMYCELVMDYFDIRVKQ